MHRGHQVFSQPRPIFELCIPVIALSSQLASSLLGENIGTWKQLFNKVKLQNEVSSEGCGYVDILDTGESWNWEIFYLKSH